MSARSRKSIKLAPGVKLNLNKKSASMTIGNKYAHVTKSSTGRTTTSIKPVKGLSYTYTQTTGKSNKPSSSSPKTQTSIPINTNSTTIKENNIEKKKNNWLLWILLTFLSPIGIVYMWITKKDFPSKKKIILTIIFGLWFLIILGNTNMSTNDTPSDISTTDNVTKQQVKDIDSHKNTNKVSSNDSKVEKNKNISIESFGSLNTTEYEMTIGDTAEFSLPISPKEISIKYIEFKMSKKAIIKIKKAKISANEQEAILSFIVVGKKSGFTKLKIKDKHSNKMSDTLSFTINKVSSIGNFSTTYYSQEVGDTIKFTLYASPKGLTWNDIKIVNSDSSVLKVTKNRRKNKTVFLFTTKAISSGNSTIYIKSKQENVKSNDISFYISKKDNSRTVYTTPTGEKYHYLSSCAGKNAITTTLNKAQISGYKPCSKCAN